MDFWTLIPALGEPTDAYFTPDGESYYVSPEGDVYTQPSLEE